MTRKRGLGKGLDALIPGDASASGEGIRRVSLDQIAPNPRQPRRAFPETALEELAASIREHGILQPLVVTPDPAGDGYLLIAGERRLQAARRAGLDSVPVIVRLADERQGLELALVENLQRDDLNPLEAAEGYRQLVEDFSLSHDEVARQVGRSRSAVSNAMRLLRLPATVRQLLATGRLSEGHARALLPLPSPQAQAAAAETVVKRGLNVRQTEDLVQRLTGRRSKPGRARRRSPEEADVEQRLRQALGTKVSLRSGRKGGSLVIHYYSQEELETSDRPPAVGLIPVKILIFGSGAVGAYLGSRLALAGHSVWYLARPLWAEALRSGGLRVSASDRSDTVVTHNVLSQLPEMLDLGPDGFVLLTVKAYDAEEAAVAIARSVRGEIPVACLTNGIGSEDTLAAHLGSTRVVPATLTSAVRTLEPGSIRVERERGIGLAAGPVADGIAEALRDARIRVSRYQDPTAMKWSKVPTNIVANPASAILGWTASRTMAHPGLARLEIEALRETFLVMRRLGHRPVDLPGVRVSWLRLGLYLPAPLIRGWLARIVGRGRGEKLPSFHYDIGRGRSEVRWLNGAVVEAGNRLGVPTPANAVLQEVLLGLVEKQDSPESWRDRPDRLIEAGRRGGVPGLGRSPAQSSAQR